MDFGWKKKADRLKMVILSGAHQRAAELPPGIAAILDLFRRVAADGGGTDVNGEFDRICAAHANEPQPLWEPADIYGWKMQATFYRQDDKLWWLFHAVRRNEKEPSDKDISFLDKVLDHFGADPTRHAIIGPRSSPPDEPRLVFGWWTWQNRWPLFDIQVNKDKKRDADKIRIVPLGTRETEGYTSLGADDFDDEAPK